MLTKALKEADAKKMLALVASPEAHAKGFFVKLAQQILQQNVSLCSAWPLNPAQGDGAVGPQHWLCDRLWEHLEGWNKQASTY